MLFSLMVFLIFGAFSVEAAVSISRTSATIKKGNSLTLAVYEDGRKVSGSVWGSSDTSVATVTQSGKVTGHLKGSAVITAMYNGSTVECLVSVVNSTKSSTVRYNVLVLDHSLSMKGSPMTQVKAAAKRFAKTVLSADGKNYVAVISYGSTSKVLCGFTGDYNKAAKAINGISSSGHTNMRASFDQAFNLMRKVSSGKNVIKNVVLCSDGLPETGIKQSSGKYTKKNHKTYKYANAVYKIDKQMKDKGYFIYALGFFHNSSGKDLKFGKQLMKDLASRDKYYIIQDSKDVKEAFEDISDAIISLSLSDNSLTLTEGGTKTIKAYLNGTAVKASDVQWTSDSSSIATVNKNGTITAVRKGTTTIRASVNGKSASCKVTVKEPVDITKGFTLYGDAVLLEDGSIRLTECTTWEGGSAWYPKKFRTTNGLSISFRYWAGGGRDYNSYNGADGIVLNFSNETGIGDEGGDLGFKGGYGVELDSYYNSEKNDPNGKHIAIIKDTIRNHLTFVMDDRVDDSEWHTVRVLYRNQSLSVYLDGKRLLVQSGVKLESDIYLGISGATGNGVNEHKIRDFKVAVY